MKKASLFLTVVISSIALVACGGSSSEPAQPVEKQIVQATAPIVTITTETTVKHLANFMLSATASDVNDDINSISWQQTAGPATSNISDSSALITSVDFHNVAGKYSFDLTVTDSGNLSTSKSIEVNITNTALLDWAKCSIDGIEQREDAQCLLHKVPLDWKNPAGLSIDNLVIRYIARQQPAKGKIWMLDGGPGGNSVWMLPTDIQQVFNIDEWDIYLPIHRGVEGPSKLECSDGSTVPTSECFNELMSVYESQLAEFNTENAAYDLADIIDKVAEGTEKDIIYGASYGTFLAQKYLQQQEANANPQVDGLILDSVAPLAFQALEMADNFDVIGLRVLAICDNNEFCRQQLDGNATEFLDDTLNKLALGQCLIGGDKQNPLNVDIAKTLLDYVLSSYKDTIPGVIKMMNRCNEQDQISFNHAYQLLTAENSTDNDNLLVLANVVSTNMHRPTMTKEDLGEHKATLRFTPDNTPFYDMADIWPLAAKPLDAGLPATAIPLLILNGGLDPQTTEIMAKQVFDNYAGAQKSLVIFPTFNHGVITKDSACVVTIVRAFINNPLDNVDSQCAGDTPSVDVIVESEYVKAVFNHLFGITSPW